MSTRLARLRSIGFRSAFARGALAVLFVLWPSRTEAAPTCPSLVLNGTSSYAIASRTVYPNGSTLASFTAEAWIYPTALPSSSGRRLIVSDDAFDLSLRFTSGAANGGLGVELALYSQTGSYSSVQYRGVRLNQWNHVALIYDAGARTVRLAVNGAVDSPASVSLSAFGVFTGTSSNLIVGAFSPTSSFFAGYIDNVRVSDSVRYQASFTPPDSLSADANTRALYFFGEPTTATSFADASGNANTLTSGGGAQAGTAPGCAAEPTIAPAIATQPTSQTVTAGALASFSAAASGSPSPTVQWQVSSNGGVTFTNITGATAGTHSFVAAAADNGKQFRAVFANTAGTATTNAVTLTVTSVPTMSLNRTSLVFSAVSTGAAFSAQTPSQSIRLSQSGAGTATWTAASTVPWLLVSPASGAGPATLTISTQFVSGLTTAQTGLINLTLTGAATAVGPVTVTLNVVPSTAAASLPFGSFDTPAGDATVLAGSIALTGWTLDNVGVKQVELWRDLQPGETTPPGNSTPGDPRTGKIFIANASFVDGARPDVEGLYPSTPANHRSGWGYLMLTWGLFGQGNGTYRFYAFGVDQEGGISTIGAKTVVIGNNTATKPFGSIDTPTIGGDASGPNFGWGLTPKVNGVPTCKIQSNGVQVSIDSGPLQPVVYGDVRSDIAGAFTGFSNTSAAGGHFIFDWSTLTNGPHTIGWLITDDCNRADGVGSRFFNVTTGTSLTAAVTPAALAARQVESDLAITVAHGFGELPKIVEAGSRIIEVEQGDRIEVRIPRGFDTAYQLGTGGEPRELPAGATWDAASGMFYWQPAPGFLGRFRLVFTDGNERINVRVIVVPPGLAKR